MIPRKNMGRVSPLLLILLALGFFFATYNLVTLIIHYRATTSSSFSISTSGSSSNGGGGSEWFDPVKESNLVKSGDRKFHVALTATDAPYSKWQCRIMYYWYKKMKERDGSEMGGFTRVLHSGKPDNLMEEIPTFVVDPLPEGLDRVSLFFIFFKKMLVFDELFFWVLRIFQIFKLLVVEFYSSMRYEVLVSSACTLYLTCGISSNLCIFMCFIFGYDMSTVFNVY